MSEHCPALATILYNIYVLPVITALAAVSIIYVTFLYIKAQRVLQLPNGLYIAGLVFFTMTFMFYIVQTNKFIFYCSNPGVSGAFRAFSVHIYGAQVVILLGILFHRMIAVFTNTVFELSNKKIKCFVAIYVVTWIALTFHAIILSAYLIWGVWLVPYSAYVVVAAAGASCMLTLNGLLIYLFIYKLIRTFQSLNANRDNLLHLITKTALLYFTSTFTLLFFIMAQPLRKLQSVHLDFVCSLIVIADVYTNFLCIFLSYEFVDSYYAKICGCCHRKCYGICSKCVNKDNKGMPRLGLENVASHGSQASETAQSTKVAPEI